MSFFFLFFLVGLGLFRQGENMDSEWFFLLVGVGTLSAAGFVLVAAVWLRGLRKTVLASLSEMAEQQIRTAQRVSETIAQLQKQQDCCAQQIRSLTQTGVRLQREISNVTHRFGNTQGENIRGGQTLH
jgi:hypothetical protein